MFKKNLRNLNLCYHMKKKTSKQNFKVFVTFYSVIYTTNRFLRINTLFPSKTKVNANNLNNLINCVLKHF